jgi:myo-inositol-1(or 4)-monophosphatase
MGRAVLCSGFSTRRHEAAFQADLRGWSLFLDYCRDMRRFGSAALELAFVGAGRLDGYWERNLRTWDVLAGICIAQEAGATVSDYQGDEALLYNAREIVASNGIIHGDMLRLLARIKGTEAPANGG